MRFWGLDPIQSWATPIGDFSGSPLCDPQSSEEVGLPGEDRALTWTVVEYSNCDFNVAAYWDTTDLGRAVGAALDHARAFFGSPFYVIGGYVYAGRGDHVEHQGEYGPEDFDDGFDLAGLRRDERLAENVASPEERVLKLPEDTALPFFAYGIFRKGQPGFGSIRQHVMRADDASVQGRVLVRDGMPLLLNEGPTTVDGSILTFHGDGAVDAYRRIAGIEPFKHYRWGRVGVNGSTANVLVAKSPNKGGAEPLDGDGWSGWNDPCFVEALEVVAETVHETESPSSRNDRRAQFRLQSAYLLLWTSIERYIALTVEGEGSIAAALRHLGSEPAFEDALALYVQDERTVSRADDPTKTVRLDPNRPERALAFYYQVRSNATHRSKAAPNDFETLRLATVELLQIFRFVLTVAQLDAAWDDGETSPGWRNKPGVGNDRRDLVATAALDLPGYRWVETPAHAQKGDPGRRWLLAPCGEPAAVQHASADAPVLPGPHPLAPIGSGICANCDNGVR